MLCVRLSLLRPLPFFNALPRHHRDVADQPLTLDLSHNCTRAAGSVAATSAP